VAVFVAWWAPSAQGQAPAKITPASPTLPLTKFYDAPQPLPEGKPGELIRFEQFDDYRLSDQVTAYRLLYHSRSPEEQDVAVSGVVLLPDDAPPAGGWPIVAWAHGFGGSARQCAPSLRKNLNEGPLLSMYVGLGFAVVASDYAGLGTNFPHAGFDIRSNAADTISAVAAARAALPQLGTRWVVAGSAQGALVAMAVAEAEPAMHDPYYLGAVGISGLAEPQELFEQLAQSSSYSLLVFLARGVKTVYPEFRVEEMLTHKAMLLYAYTESSCDANSGPLPAASEMVKPGWENNLQVKAFFARNALGRKAASAPVLLIAGQNDTVIPFDLTARAVARLCGQKDRVLFVKYPTINASAVMENSVSEQVSWIKARFSRLPAPCNCP